MTRRWNSSRHADPSLHRLSMHMMAPHEYAVRSLTDGVDIVAVEMERKWGIDRLRLLVPSDLRAKFDSQRDRFNAALEDGSVQAIEVQAEAMKRAWQKLDLAATELGNKPLSAEVWECQLPTSGRIVSIVRTAAEAHLVASDDREVWTLEEVAKVIDGMGDLVSQVKRTFPGAEITAIHSKTNPPEKPFDWSKGDDIPF